MTGLRPVIIWSCFFFLPHWICAADDPAGIEFFEKRIRPVLVQHCYKCHSTESKKLEGGLSLESRDALLHGGEQGPAIVPGDPAKSLLLQAIRYDNDSLQMPPKEPLPANVVADFETWIKRGAPDPRTAATKSNYAIDIDQARERWPFKPPTPVAVPAVKNSAWPTGPVDHFILAQLEQNGLAPVADADKRTLIRRVTYDLTGLPPTAAEVDAFLLDFSPHAFATVVDRLLASPQYGQRWGRHWLDVVRYADTAGDNSDYPIPQMYLYRNWVITAINDDLPYDQFIRQQLAGDLLPADNDQQKYQQTIATGYIANARRFGSRVDDYPQHLTIEDTIDNLGKTFLGLSINCARCHNHKFDPITTEDYYALYGVFHSTRYPWPGIELLKYQKDLVPLAPPDQVAAADRQRKDKLKELNDELKQLAQQKSAAQKQVDEVAKKLAETRKQAGESADECKSLEKALADAKDALSNLEKQVKSAQQNRDNLEKSPANYPVAYAIAEGKKVENVAVQIKGDPERKGSLVERRTPVVFGGQTLPKTATTSGRREFADWIASPENPLTARVIVNRLWHYHFGQGLVSTPNDFGRQGKPPSHPELLDYLALRLIDSGWSLKAMHRTILLSRTYQLSTQDDAAALAREKDPSNTLLWRANRRRLDAESIRDTLLFVSGDLDLSVGGEHPFPAMKDWNFTQHNPFKAIYDTNRRSVYLMTQRIQRHPYLAIFDGPDTSASTGSRITSTTTLQALYLLNDQFVHERAANFVEQLCDHCSDDGQRIEDAYLILLSRPPTPDERQDAKNYLIKIQDRLTSSGASHQDATRSAWNSLTRVLFRMNEFIYLN